MTFLSPFVLFGLIAAAVPVLIHLLQLKKLRSVEFSSIRFLKEIQHASAKRVKLRDFLLLLLRTLAIASLVIAFARPALKGIAGKNSKSSSVIIIDNSPSTAARNEYGEVFSQIKNVASNLIANSHVGDNVGLIFTSGSRDTSQFLSTINSRSLSPQVSRAELSNISGTYTSAITAALDRLKASNYAEKEIYLVGDLQRTEFLDANPPTESTPSNTRIFFMRTKESSTDNLSVSNVKLSNPVVEVNVPSETVVTITNNGGSDKSGVVASLYLDDRKVAQSVIDISASAFRKVNLVFNVPSSGFHKGMVQIDDNSIQSDNKFYFSFYAIKKLNVAIVTSHPENDFVISATQAVMDTSTKIDSRVVSPDEFVYSDLSKTDVIVTETYQGTQSFQSKVAQFVENGGGAILFAPNLTQERNSGFAGIIGSMNLGRVSRFFSNPGTSFLSLEKIDAGDDFFSGIFSSKQGADQIKNELVTKVVNGVQIAPNPFAHILMSAPYFPFIMDKEVGSGFVFVISSPADSLSSNFPISPFFPVVVQRALFYSAAVRHQPIQILAGKNIVYRYSTGGTRSATLISPEGGKTVVVPRYVGGAATFELRDLSQLGTYSLVVGGFPVCEISVNVDPRESNLSQAPHEEITSFAKKLGFSERNIFVVDADKNAVASVEKLRRGEDLSSFFAGAALLFLILEIFVLKMKTF